LGKEISAAVISVSEQITAVDVRNFRRHLQMASNADDAKIENSVTLLSISHDY
jgi:hypothetical protein